MNAKNIIAIAAMAACFGSAFAATPAFPSTMGDADPGYPVAQTSSVTRAQVMAERDQRNPQGFSVQGEAFIFAEAVGTPLTRAQVRAETLEAIRVGAISRSERYEFPTAQQLESIRLAGLRALDPNVAANPQPAVN